MFLSRKPNEVIWITVNRAIQNYTLINDFSTETIFWTFFPLSLLLFFFKGVIPQMKSWTK